MLLSARFDALDPFRSSRSFRFEQPLGSIVAGSLSDVGPALRRLDDAIARGEHVAGYIGYEAAAGLGTHLRTSTPDSSVPLLAFGRFAARHEIDDPAPAPNGWAGVTDLRASVGRAAYEDAVRRILELIAAGDTYQVNYTFRLRGRLAGREEDLYERIRASQRSAYCAHLRFEDFSLLSASPELFFRRDRGVIELRPMKGTRPRGRWVEEDERLAAELEESAKDRAENLMIVDLLRNDAGRIARFGSVSVPELFQVERYPTVHQMTSTVRAEIAPSMRLSEIVRALHPSGSVTGAPKVRTCEIIAKLEDSPRGVYTGAIGFASAEEAVFNVAIRTLVLDRGSGAVELGVGSGITADSDPAAEYRECMAKAAFLDLERPSFRLLESLRFEPGTGYPMLERHLERIGGSAAYFGYRFDGARARALLLRHGAELSGDAFKVRLTCGEEGEMEVDSARIVPSPAPLRVSISADPVNSDEVLLYHKTTARDGYQRRRDERADCDEVLLVNERGELTEATSANLLVRLAGEWYTPPLEAGLLPGVCRALLLEEGRVRVRSLRPTDLERAEEVALVNSVRGWMAARVVA